MSTPSTIRPSFFQRLLKTLFGISSNVWNVAEPILKSSIGNFLAVAVPIATDIIVKTLANGGQLDDTTRNAATDKLKSALISRGMQAGVHFTTGLAKYAIDTAFHTAKLQGKI